MRQASLDGNELCASDPVGLVAGLVGMVGQAEKVANGVEREPERSRVPHEGEAFARGFVVAPLIALRPSGSGEQADLLVVADRRRLGVGQPSDLTDGVGARRLGVGLRHAATEKGLEALAA